VNTTDARSVGSTSALLIEISKSFTSLAFFLVAVPTFLGGKTG
jgi:hypothetical protein